MESGFWQTIIQKDQQLFLFLNGIHSDFSNWFFGWYTNKYVWIPLYLFITYLLVKTYKKTGWYILIMAVLAVVIADFITSGLMKPYFERFRPCHDPVIGHLVNTVTGCGGQYGFASSHSSTSFALATTIFLFTKQRLVIGKWLFVWAAIYAYSRIAVGVHYPGDIIVGTLIGVLTGTFMVQLSNKFYRKLD